MTDVSEISGFTPGPWTSTGLEVRDAHGPICLLSVVRNLGDGTRRASSEVYTSAALIAAAPDMHAEIARLRAGNDLYAAENKRLFDEGVRLRREKAALVAALTSLRWMRYGGNSAETETKDEPI
jgi:hypothetical protein